MLRRRNLLAALAALPLAGALPACNDAKKSDVQPNSASGLTQVKLALDWVPEPEFGGFYAAREAGKYKAEGLDVEIQGGGAGVPVVQMVASGKAEFGIAGADEVITARARGADVVPLYAVFQKSPQGIMVRASRGAKTMTEALSKGTLAIEPGLSYAVFLKKKIGFDKVKVVPYDGGVARFLADEDFAQQCFAFSEPLAAKRQGKDKGVEPKVFLVADEGFNPYLGVVITRSALWKEKPEVVKKFVRATREGWKGYLADPSAANAVMAKLNRTMDAETFAAAAEAQRPFVESDDTKARGLGAMSKERWEMLAKQMGELGIVEKASAPELPQVE
jgi:NitT/TauT family transport system substrate-binding protein